MTNFSFIGKRIPKMDAPEKLTGETVYIQDLKVPKMLYGKIKRSEYPHAIIKSIDTSKAEKLPGVKAVLTRDNIPVKNFKIGFMQDNPPIKFDKVRQYRDEVAAVAAVSEEIAEEACNLINVEYEPLPAVFEPLEAMKDGAPVIHSTDFRGNSIKNNVLPVKWHIEHGNLEEAKKKAKYIVENTYKTGWAHHCCMGTTGIIAMFDLNNNLTLHLPTQIPNLVQNDFNLLLKALGLKNKSTRVIIPSIGGAFGNKLDTHCYEYISVLLAWLTKRPVKILFDREEEFIAMAPRQPSIIKISQGCDANGKLLFREAEAVLDNGAYTSWGATTPSVMFVPMSSLYKVEAFKFDAKCVYTNNIYSQAFRGYGNPQASFAIECNIDELAKEAGIDPLDFRLLNANEPGETTPMGLKITSCSLKECLQEVKKELEWNKRREKGIGVGVASLIHVGGAARIYRSDGHGMMLRVDDFGKVFIYTGAAEIGQGSETVIAQTTAEVLGVFPEDVKIVRHDTDVSPWDVGTHASRQMYVSCKAAIRCAKEAKEKILEYASKFMKDEVVRKNRKNGKFDDEYLDLLFEPENLEIKNRYVYLKEHEELKDYYVGFDKILRRIHFRGNKSGNMIVTETFFEPDTDMLNPKTSKGNLSETYAFAAHGAEVKVDSETGEVNILKFVAAHDVGKAMNPLLLEGQIYGGVMQGIGFCLYENMISEKGKILNADFLDYKIPTITDVPDIKIKLIEKGDPKGPFGAKGIGEIGLIPVSPAIANAVEHAAGVRITELPISCEKVLEKIKEEKKY
jgi:xanthine dehydrogenase molybdenum-binding subunit